MFTQPDELWSALGTFLEFSQKDKRFARCNFEHRRDFALLGHGGSLDSLNLVAFLLRLEQYAQEQWGYRITLTHDKAFSQKNSPFLTLGSLSDYIWREFMQNPKLSKSG